MKVLKFLENYIDNIWFEDIGNKVWIACFKRSKASKKIYRSRFAYRNCEDALFDLLKLIFNYKGRDVSTANCGICKKNFRIIRTHWCTHREYICATCEAMALNMMDIVKENPSEHAHLLPPLQRKKYDKRRQ